MNKKMKQLLSLLLTLVLTFSIQVMVSAEEDATTTTPDSIAEVEETTDEEPVADEDTEEEVIILPSAAITLSFTAMDLPTYEYSFTYTEETLSAPVAETTEAGDLISGLDLADLGLVEISDGIQSLLPEPYVGNVFILSNDEALLAALVALFDETAYSVDGLFEAPLVDENPEDEEDEDEDDSENAALVHERNQLAKEYGITPGKMNLLEKLMFVYGEDFDLEAWLTAPVKDVMKAIKDLREKELEEDDADAELKALEAKILNEKKAAMAEKDSKPEKANKENKSQGKGKK